MSKIICITNQIARSGKTATAIGIAAAYALMEKRTLLIDCDPQGIATEWMGLAVQTSGAHIYHAFMGQIPAQKIILRHDMEFLSILPSGIEFFQAEHRLAVKPGKEMILQRMVQAVDEMFDYIVIDSPSTLGFYTICALASAEWIVIPIQCKAGALVGLKHLLEVVRMVRGELNPKLKIAGMLLTMKSNAMTLSEIFPHPMYNEIEDNIFQTIIPQDEAIESSQARHQPIPFYDLMAQGAQSYFDLAIELNTRIHK